MANYACSFFTFFLVLVRDWFDQTPSRRYGPSCSRLDQTPNSRIRSSERWLRRVLSQDSRSLLPLHPQALQNLSPATKKRHRENGQEFFREKSTAADDSLSSSDNSSDSDSDSEESPTSSSDYHSDAVVGKSPQKKKAGGIKSERIKKRHQQFQAPPRFLCCPNQDCLITLKQALQQFTTSR